MADDWWDRLYATPTPETKARKTRWWGSAPDPEPTHVRVEVTAPTAPRQRETVREAAAALLPTDPARARRVRIVAYNGGAAAAGWMLGLPQWFTAGLSGAETVSEGVWTGVGLVLVVAVLVELRTHGLRDTGRHPLVRAVGWAARIPLASAVLALALFTPDAAL